MRDVKIVRRFEGELYAFERNGTLYEIIIADLGGKGRRLEGGRFLVTLLSPVKMSYCFNWEDGDYIAPNYVKGKFPGLGDRDAESVSEFLNEYFQTSSDVFLSRVSHPNLRID